MQVVCHRVVWAFLTLLLCLPWILDGMGTEARMQALSTIRRRSTWLMYATAAGLIGMNWLTFVWAVNHDRVLEASLGYYINPLLNVLVGVWILGERLSAMQWAAIACAGCGVAIMTVAQGGLPWVSLLLACTFACYALIKKKAPLPALLGLLLENASLILPALAYILWVEFATSGGAFHTADARLVILLVLSGIVTISPLALFAFAALRAPLSAIGVLQYIAPTLQFLLGVFLFGEPFGRWQLIGFVFVWIALLLYMSRSRRPEAAVE